MGKKSPSRGDLLLQQFQNSSNKAQISQVKQSPAGIKKSDGISSSEQKAEQNINEDDQDMKSEEQVINYNYCESFRIKRKISNRNSKLFLIKKPKKPRSLSKKTHHLRKSNKRKRNRRRISLSRNQNLNLNTNINKKALLQAKSRLQVNNQLNTLKR